MADSHRLGYGLCCLCYIADITRRAFSPINAMALVVAQRYLQPRRRSKDLRGNGWSQMRQSGHLLPEDALRVFPDCRFLGQLVFAGLERSRQSILPRGLWRVPDY